METAWLSDRPGTLHITIFFNILGNVRLQQGSLFKFLVDARSLDQHHWSKCLQDILETPQLPPFPVQH